MHKSKLFINCAVVSALIVLGWVGDCCLRRLAPLAAFGEGVASAAVIGHARDAAVPSLPKLRVGVRHRHLIEDETGKPFFMAGVTPQNLIQTSSARQMDIYFADRQARHFNFAWVIINGYNMSKPRPILEDTQSAENPPDASGHRMLLKGTSWNPQNLNPAYVASVDAMVRSAANHGIYLFLDPFGAAYDWGPGDFDPAQHSNEEMRQWGEFWGNRYKNYPHVNFLFGADRLVWPQVDSVASGLMKYMPDRLMTIDWIGGPPDWSSDATGPHKFYDSGHRWINYNGWYQYHAPQWATWYHYNMDNPVMPTGIVETFYEFCTYGDPKNSVATPTSRLRQEVWGTVLNGGSGFGIVGCPDCLDDPLKWLGKTPGVEQAQYCTDFFKDRHWYDLVPDWSHTFLTSQSGIPGKDDFAYVSAALTRDGSLGLCYYPGETGKGFHLIINMSKMGGGGRNSRARWLDPTNGTYRTIGSFPNSGSHIFTTPEANSRGAADWVLVLESN